MDSSDDNQNAVIVSSDDTQVLRAYSRSGVDWTKDLAAAWRCNPESKIAARIARRVDGKIVPISQLV